MGQGPRSPGTRYTDVEPGGSDTAHPINGYLPALVRSWGKSVLTSREEAEPGKCLAEGGGSVPENEKDGYVQLQSLRARAASSFQARGRLPKKL